MGEQKKDVTELANLCRAWMPAFKAAVHLRNIGISRAMDSPEFISFAEIQERANAASGYTISGTHRIVSLAVRAGLIEKNPNGGRGGLYRGTDRMKAVLAADVKPDNLYVIAKYGDIFNALNSETCGQSDLCAKIGAQQTTVSLKMKKLILSGWIDQERNGKEVLYSLSNYARQIMPVVKRELRKLK